MQNLMIQGHGQRFMEMGTHTAEVDMHLPSKHLFDGARIQNWIFPVACSGMESTEKSTMLVASRHQ